MRTTERGEADATAARAPHAAGDWKGLDRTIQLLLLTTAFVVYWVSPVRQVSDSKYCLAPTYALLESGTLAVDAYFERVEPRDWGFMVTNGHEHHIEIVGDRLYHFFPPGSFVLAVPFVAVAKLCGVGIRDAAGKYDLAVDSWLQCLIAAAVCSLVVALSYRAARWLLPRGQSLLLAIAVAFGSPIWSTASRALWGDTWGCLLGLLLVCTLVRRTATGERMNGAWFGTLLAWMFLTRPQSASMIAALFVFLLLRDRRTLVTSAVVAAAWLGAFLLWSQCTLGKPLPTYFQSSRLGTPDFFGGLLGVLFSPGRGTFVYLPTAVVALACAVRSWRFVTGKSLTIAVAVGISLNLLTIASYVHWWGGYSYGGRLATGVVPWFVLLAILALDAANRRFAARGNARRAPWTVAWVTTLAASILLHSQGALAPATWMWNAVPDDIDESQERLWDWRHPQFLAGLQQPPPAPPPAASLPVGVSIPFADPAITPGLSGWAEAENGGRWTVDEFAIVRLRVERGQAHELELVLQPHLIGDRVPAQRIAVQCNGSVVAELVLATPTQTTVRIPIPADITARPVEIRLQLPDRARPNAKGGTADQRTLGVFCSSCRLVRP